MARLYEWKRIRQDRMIATWEYATTDSPDVPPEGVGWVRVYSFGIGSVQGAGGSPARRVSSGDH